MLDSPQLKGLAKTACLPASLKSNCFSGDARAAKVGDWQLYLVLAHIFSLAAVSKVLVTELRGAAGTVRSLHRDSLPGST